VLSPSSPDWPAVLADLEQPPTELAIAGALPDLTKAVAIVGTRRPDANARGFTRGLARELASAGCAIVSGGALGIDTEAHLGALEVGGVTIAVLATGLERPYPAQNCALFSQIAQRGALLSEALEPTPGWASAFLDRNRIIAALAPVVIVVQAPYRSGALSTASHANKLGRQLLAVPHAPWEVRGAGCLTLLAKGARVCRSSTDVLSLAAPKGQKLPSPHPGGRKKVYENPDLDEDERAVVRALEGGPSASDELCESTGLSAPRVQRAILMLLLSSVIQEVGCGRYARRDCL
jgi:DNA processing protein